MQQISLLESDALVQNLAFDLWLKLHLFSNLQMRASHVHMLSTSRLFASRHATSAAHQRGPWSSVAEQCLQFVNHCQLWNVLADVRCQQDAASTGQALLQPLTDLDSMYVLAWMQNAIKAILADSAYNSKCKNAC